MFVCLLNFKRRRNRGTRTRVVDTRSDIGAERKDATTDGRLKGGFNVICVAVVAVESGPVTCRVPRSAEKPDDLVRTQVRVKVHQQRGGAREGHFPRLRPLGPAPRDVPFRIRSVRSSVYALVYALVHRFVHWSADIFALCMRCRLMCRKAA